MFLGGGKAVMGDMTGSKFDKIAICTGHMIDAPDRETPRFPAAKAESGKGKDRGAV